jgi:hypothetical protein
VAEWTDHPVELLTELFEDVYRVTPPFAVLAEMREYMDELVPVPPDLLDVDVFDDPIIK